MVLDASLIKICRFSSITRNICNRVCKQSVTSTVFLLPVGEPLFGPWSKWSACELLASCGPGKQMRNRDVAQREGDGKTRAAESWEVAEERPCYKACPPTAGELTTSQTRVYIKIKWQGDEVKGCSPIIVHLFEGLFLHLIQPLPHPHFPFVILNFLLIIMMLL